MIQKKHNIRNVKSMAALLVIALVAMFSLEGCIGKILPKKPVPEVAADTLAAEESVQDEASQVESAGHAQYDGLSLNMSIDAFKKALEERGYALGEKDPAHKMIKMFNQMEALWVYYDSKTEKVWMVVNIDLHYEDMELGRDGERRIYEILIPEYEKKYNSKRSGFCEGVDCVDIPGGTIIFAYDKDCGALVMTVDKVNSNNYDNLMDTTYGISPYGLED